SFVEQLWRRWGRDVFAGEFSHAGEHSIEFQAVYLQALDLTAPAVAILCDSLHGMVPDGKSPRSVALLADFVDALRTCIAEDGRRVTIIAAVDLAHVG